MQAHRVDVFLSGMDHALVAVDLCNTPYPEKAHGGSNATIGLVYDTEKRYPDYDFEQAKKQDPDKEPISGNDVKAALGAEGGPLIGVLLERIKLDMANSEAEYSKQRYLEILLQLKRELDEIGVMCFPKKDYQVQQIVVGILASILEVKK